MTDDWDHVPSPRHLGARRVDAESASLAELSSARHRWTPRLTVLTVAGGAAIALTGTVAYVAFAPVDDTSFIECYSDDTAAGSAFSMSELQGYNSASPPVSGATDGPMQIADPVASCGDMWRQGVLVAGSHTAHDPRPDADLPVPPLVACVADQDGQRIVAVIPGDSGVCARLGMPRWQQ